MNKFLSTGILLLAALQSGAQIQRNSSIALSYDNVSVGRNINFTYIKPVSKKWSVYGGVKYLINSKYYRNDYTVTTYLFKGFYGNTAEQHLGLKLGLQRFLITDDHLDLFAYYDFQFTRATVRAFEYFWPSGQFPVVPTGAYDYRDIFNSYENIVGLGLRLKINKDFRFRIQAGLGVNFYKMVGTNSYLPKDQWNSNNGWTYSRQLSFGTEYLIPRKSNSKHKSKKNEPYVAEDQNYNSFSLSYNDVQTGSNISLHYNHSLPMKFRIYGGLSFHINTPYFRDYTITEPYYFKQFRPEGLLEHLGINAGLERVLQIPNTNLSLFGFYEIQAMRSTVSNLVDLSSIELGSARSAETSHGIGNEKSDYDYPTFRKYGPVVAIQNYLGAGARIKVSPSLNLKLKGAIGYNFYIGPDNFQDYYTINGNGGTAPPTLHTNVAWTAKQSEISRMFSVGLEYKLKNK